MQAARASCKMSAIARSGKTTATERGVANGSLPAAEAADGSRMFVDALKLAMCAGSGVIFGMAAEKGKGIDSVAAIVLH